MSEHIMFSYQWDSESLVSKIFDYLTKIQSIPIWMDKHGGMTEYLTTSMAEGVENCCVIVCFLTPEYQESINCKKELTYASQLRKSIIPCLLGSKDSTRKWKPSQWLGLTIADLLYLNLTQINEHNFEDLCQQLLDKIHSILGLIHPQPVITIEKEESDDEDEDWEATSSLIVPPIIREGPQIDDQTPIVIPKIYSSEGDSMIDLLNQSTEIKCNQDLYATNGRFVNSLTFSRLVFHNRSSQSLSILHLSSKYENKEKEWIPCQININDHQMIKIPPNEIVLCSITIRIELNGLPGIDNEHRFRVHHLLPQPLRIEISIEDTQMKHSTLLLEQINQPLNLPTLQKLLEKLHLSQSDVLGFISADDCSIEIRYFLLISSCNDPEPSIKFSFGCDLSSLRSPTWNKQSIQTLQKLAKKEKKLQLNVHEDVFHPFIHCLALFNEYFQLHGIRITIQTKTSTTIQTIPLSIKQIFAEHASF